MNRFICLTLASFLGLVLAGPSYAQPGKGRGGGLGPGAGGGPGAGQGVRRGGQQHGRDERHDAERNVFHFLLQNHSKIKRTVKETPTGVETLTESDSPEVANMIKEHVEWMKYRIDQTHPIRRRDPLFAELFKHTDKIEMVYQNTRKGVRVTETSSDPYVVKLIQAHAKTVSAFVENGFAEAMKPHPVPVKDIVAARDAKMPVIQGHGDVVQLPAAAQQPRAGTKIVIDLTRGGDADKINAGLEKVAKYLNIYAGGGAEPADVHIAVVLHGDATLAVLNSDAYAEKFGTQGNPNSALLRQLHEADVDLYVCGQSLLSAASKPEEVTVFIETAVSAISSVANLQADGYAYIPIGG